MQLLKKWKEKQINTDVYYFETKVEVFCGSFMFLFCLVFAMFCARLFICASWSPAGKGLTSWLSFVVSSVSLSLSHWYPGSGVVLDCIDSWSLQPYLLLYISKTVKIFQFTKKMHQFRESLCRRCLGNWHHILIVTFWGTSFIGLNSRWNPQQKCKRIIDGLGLIRLFFWFPERCFRASSVVHVVSVQQVNLMARAS